MWVDFYLKLPINVISYVVDIISLNKGKLLISISLIMATYGWIEDASAMRESIISIYQEMKTTIMVITSEIWITAQVSISTVWNTLSVIAMLQFVFLLLLLLCIPDTIDYMKKSLVRYAKLA